MSGLIDRERGYAAIPPDGPGRYCRMDDLQDAADLNRGQAYTWNPYGLMYANTLMTNCVVSAYANAAATVMATQHPGGDQMNGLMVSQALGRALGAIETNAYRYAYPDSC